MPRNALDVSADNTTTRLINLAKAYRLTGDLPCTSARELVNFANSVRLFAMAREPKAALAMLDRILDMFPPGDADLVEPRAAFLRAINNVRAALGAEMRRDAAHAAPYSKSSKAA